MPRGQYARKAKSEITEVSGIVKTDAFSSLAWWKKLNSQEQATVVSEGQKLAVALLHFGQSRLAIGEHLSVLQGILEPHNVFQKFLKNFHFSKRTAYRYIKGYQNAKARLPETVLKAAMARGVAIIGDTDAKPLGVYTSAAVALPPPSTATEMQANTYLDQLEAVRHKARSEEVTGTIIIPTGDPNTLMKECLRFVATRFKRLPTNSRSRQAWATKLVGMLLVEFGINAPQQFAPVQIPETFQVHRGRPKQATTPVAATA